MTKEERDELNEMKARNVAKLTAARDLEVEFNRVCEEIRAETVAYQLRKLDEMKVKRDIAEVIEGE